MEKEHCVCEQLPAGLSNQCPKFCQIMVDFDYNRHVIEQQQVVEAHLGTSAGIKCRLEDAYQGIAANFEF